MAYTTNLGSNPLIIDDSNAHEFAEQVRDPSTPFSGGYVNRDYARFPFGHYAPPFSGQIIPRSQWTDLIKRQDDNETSPLHVHKKNKLPILDQNGLPYCWGYGVTAAIMNRYAAFGMQPVPHLSATSCAAQIKGFRKQGGWAGEFIKGLAKYGLATVQTWPEHSMDRSLVSNNAVRLDMQRHGIVEFEELPSQNFEAAISALLNPYNPCPVTMGLGWWGHLVCGLRAVVIEPGRFGIAGANSWTAQWGDHGYFVLAESKATAQEYVAVRRIKPRSV